MKYVALMSGIRNGLYFKKYNVCENVDDCLDYIRLMKHQYDDVEWQDVYVAETTRIFMSEDEFKNEVSGE